MNEVKLEVFMKLFCLVKHNYVCAIMSKRFYIIELLISDNGCHSLTPTVFFVCFQFLSTLSVAQSFFFSVVGQKMIYESNFSFIRVFSLTINKKYLIFPIK